MDEIDGAPPPAKAKATSAPDEMTAEQYAIGARLSVAFMNHLKYLHEIADGTRLPLERWSALREATLKARI